MRQHNVLAGFAVLLVSGCAGSELKLAPVAPDSPWTPATTSSGEIVPGRGDAKQASKGYILPANDSITAPTPPPLDDGHAYTLAELIDIAERTNPMTRIAWNQARDAALTAGIAQAQFLPRIAIIALGGYATNNGTSALNGVDHVSDNSLGGGTMAVSLDWLLFDFGQRQATVDAARQFAIISDIDFTQAHQRLIYDVSVAFYAHAATAARVQASIDGLANAHVIANAAGNRLKYGQGTIVEVAQAKQLVAQAELKLIQARGVAQDSAVDLLAAVGVSPLTKIQFAEISGRTLPSEVDTELDQLIAASIGRRADVLDAFAIEKARQADVRGARADFMPKFFVTGSGSYSAGDLDLSAIPGVGNDGPTLNIPSHHFGATVLAGVRMPLFDGGMRSAKLAQARDRVDSANESFDEVRNQAIREIVSTDNSLRTALEAHHAAGALLDAAQASYAAALAAYQHGVGSITEVATAQTQLVEARSAESDSYSVALSAAASLALASGMLGSAPN